MTATMSAYRIVAWGRPPQLTEVPVPEPGAGEVLVEVAANGLCHSDLGMGHIPAGMAESLGWQLPFTLGHEIAGHIAALGPGVTGLAEGEAVALVSPASCGRCPACLRGHDSACPHGSAGRGYGRDGGLARYVVAPAPRAVVKLGDLDPVAAAPLTDAGATVHHAVDRVVARLTEGSTAVVLGAGGLGAFAVQILRALTPARVVAVDTNPARLAVVRDLGAHEVLDDIGALARGRSPVPAGGDPGGGSPVPGEPGRGGSGGVEVVLDFVGVDATIAGGLAAVRPYGAYGLVGSGGGTLRRPWFGTLPRDADVFTFQGSSLADVHAVVALARRDAIRSDVDVFPLSQVADAYAALDRGELRGRAVVVPDI
ncbi:MAG TPA: alcohol dehydrogenase catalytic domain-containing protein [Acidimicrobiales bacterium]